MANVYFDLSLTGSGGAGTEANPYTGTQARAQLAALANGDTAYLCGRLDSNYTSAAAVTMASKTGVTWRQWSGQKQACISGGIPVTGAWTGPVSNVYSTTLATGLSILGVTIRYYDPARLNGEYSRCAYLAKVATPSGTDHSFNYNSGTGALQVRSSLLSAAPSTYTAALSIPAAWADQSATVAATPITLYEIEYIRANPGSTGTTYFNGCSTTLLKGIMWDRGDIRSTTEASYLLDFVGGTGNRTENCWVTDGGYHNIGHIGTTNASNVVAKSLVSDMGAYNGGTSTVHYNSTTTPTTRAEIQGSRIRSSHLRGVAGTILAVDNGYGGAYSGYTACYAHTNATPTLTDMTVRDCEIVMGDHYANVEGTTAGNQEPKRGDVNDTGDYVFQAINNRYRYEAIAGRTVTTRPQLSITTNTGSYRNCRFDFSGSGYTTGANINTTGNNGTIFYPSSITQARTLFSGCTFISDQTPNSGANPSVFVCTRTAGINNVLTFENCTFVLNGAWSSGDVLFACSADADNTAELRFKRCMFINAATITGSGSCYLFATYSAQNTTQTLQRLNRTFFEGCAYIGLNATTGYFRIANFGSGTAAAWTAVTGGAWDGTPTPPIGGMDPGAFTRAYTASEWNTTTWQPTNATIRAALKNARTSKGSPNSNGSASRGIGAAPYGPIPQGFPPRNPPFLARG